MTVPAVVVITPEALAELVRRAVEDALAEQGSEDVAPVFLDRKGIARRLGVGLSMVDRLRREGMPYVMIGDDPRFVADDCVAFLRERKSAQDA